MFLRLAAPAALFVATGVGGQPLYSLQDLGPLVDLPGRTDSGPIAINRSGVVAGVNVTNGNYRAMIYNGVWQDLGTLGGAESLAAGIDDLGRVVGFSQTANGVTNAFLWTASATNAAITNPQMQDLGTLGGLVSEAYAINDTGGVTGYSDAPARPNTQQHAFLFSAGKMTDIGLGLPGLPNSFGYGINARGHVVGAAFDVAYTAPHAFFFDGTNTTDLGVFGGLGATALAVNNSDNFVGYLTTTSMVDHAFSSIAGTVTDLGTLGGNYSYGLAINNSNVIVGGSFIDDKNSIYHAFVSENGSIKDLNSYLNSSGAGWTLTEARAINDAGQIVGVGAVGGVTHGFLLTLAVTNPAPLEITSLTQSVSNTVVQFTSVAGAQYTIQTNLSLSPAGWLDASPLLSGTGGTLSFTNPAPPASAMFYRVKQSGP